MTITMTRRGLELGLCFIFCHGLGSLVVRSWIVGLSLDCGASALDLGASALGRGLLSWILELRHRVVGLGPWIVGFSLGLRSFGIGF